MRVHHRFVLLRHSFASNNGRQVSMLNGLLATLWNEKRTVSKTIGCLAALWNWAQVKEVEYSNISAHDFDGSLMGAKASTRVLRVIITTCMSHSGTYQTWRTGRPLLNRQKSTVCVRICNLCSNGIDIIIACETILKKSRGPRDFYRMTYSDQKSPWKSGG